MDTNESLVPHILCAMSSAPDQQQSVGKIIRFVEDRLGEQGKQINNLKNEIEKALQVANEFGLISSNNNTVRLRYNPNSKPPFGFQSSDGQRESRRSVQTEGRGEAMDDDDGQNETTTTDDNKTRDKTKSTKNSGKKPSDYSIFVPVPSEIRRRKKKSRGRSKRGRSRSRRRRRRR